MKFLSCGHPEPNQFIINFTATCTVHEAPHIGEHIRALLMLRKLEEESWVRQDQQNSKGILRVNQLQAFSARLLPLLNGIAFQGLTSHAMVMLLNELAVRAPKGGLWSLGQVQRLIDNASTQPAHQIEDAQGLQDIAVSNQMQDCSPLLVALTGRLEADVFVGTKKSANASAVAQLITLNPKK